jgi:hypothetical protein
VYRNTDAGFRDYDGMLFQGRYNITNRWTLNGHYTLQLNNSGNYEGEGANTPGATGRIGDYPEIFTANRHYPEGDVDDFQRHKARFWTIYNLGLSRFGDAALSALWRIDGARVYSLAAAGQPITSTQREKLVAAGYPDEPSSQTVFFSERGSETFKGFQVWDLAATYNIPVFRTLRPYLNLAIYNAFNNQKLISWNTTVSQDTTTPVDGNGLRTGYRQGANFGKATATTQFPLPFQGQTGGRTWRIAAGFRF